MSTNFFLASLSSSDRALLLPHLTLLNVRRGQALTTAGEPVQSIFFPINAAVSLVVSANDRPIEVAILGSDDVVNAGFALGVPGRHVSSALVQNDGEVLACEISKFENEIKSESLTIAFAQAQQRLFDQSSLVAACATTHSLEARFARWLLRTHDTIGKNKLNFTQDQVADLLGVSRTYLSKAIEQLRRRKIIKPGRGKLTILNPEALSRRACHCYELIRSLYERSGQSFLKESREAQSQFPSTIEVQPDPMD